MSMSPDSLPGLVDSHCHLQMGGDDSVDSGQLLEAAKECGVDRVLVPGTDLDQSIRALELAHRHDGVFAAAGFHPHEASRYDQAAERALERLLADPRCVAVGEIGLDYFYDHSPRDEQRRVLRRQMEMAREAGMPVILHNRDSAPDLLSVLEEFPGVTGVMHSFCDTPETLGRALDLGYFISYSGMVTFRAADNVRQTVALVPDDRLLVETDTPYLAPVPHRGRTNQPAWVLEVVKEVARVRGTEPVPLVQTMAKNFDRLFPKVSGKAGA